MMCTLQETRHKSAYAHPCHYHLNYEAIAFTIREKWINNWNLMHKLTVFNLMSCYNCAQIDWKRLVSEIIIIS